MSRTLRAVSTVLAAALLAASMAAFTPGDESEAKAALGPVQAVTVAAADFRPIADEMDFTDIGYYLYGEGVYVARVPFPAEVVVVASVKARVYDDRPGSDMCVYLHRARPGDAAEDAFGSVCTTGRSGQTPQTLSITAFKRVGGFQTASVWVGFDTKDPDLRLYGATVFYRVVS